MAKDRRAEGHGFSASDHEPLNPEMGRTAERGSSTTGDEQARALAISEPDTDPNDAREIYGLKRLPPDQIQLWLDGEMLT